MKVTPSTRRRFLRTSVAAAATVQVLPRALLGGPKFVPPSEKVNVAVVGVGGRGLQNLRELLALADVQVIAVADPARTFSLEAFYYKGTGGRAPAQAAVEKHYAAKTPNFRCAAYEDFRVLLEQERAVDAVLCATPDHLHAGVSLRALRAGKHV
jgi:predicted dehydrogenase